MATVPLGTAPRVEPGRVHFCVPDPGRELVAVRLRQDLVRPRSGPRFEWREEPRVWRLTFPRPAVDRMEYLVELVRDGGDVELGPDPGNPLRAPGPFGDKSVIEFPGYRPPAWLLEEPAPDGERRTVEIAAPRLGDVALPAVLWSSPGADPSAELPLLLVHDGPEYERYSSLLVLLDRLAAAGRLPAMRAALVGPLDRDEIYSASPRYAEALVEDVLPALRELAPSPRGRASLVGLGASLGALALLHAQRAAPGTFAGLVLQSGSFFRRRSDPQEQTFGRFDRIERFVERVHAGRDEPDRIPVAMTCGRAEENLANNRTMRATLHRQGYRVRLHENRDAHNWVAWRDALDPPLVDLLREVWR